MSSQTADDTPRVGDIVTIDGHRVGEAGRTGEILEVMGTPGHVHFRMRWDDGHESLFFPSSDAIVRPRPRPRPRRKAPAKKKA